MQTAFTDAIRAAQDELRVEVATSPEQLREAQQLRFPFTAVGPMVEHHGTASP